MPRACATGQATIVGTRGFLNGLASSICHLLLANLWQAFVAYVGHWQSKRRDTETVLVSIFILHVYACSHTEQTWSGTLSHSSRSRCFPGCLCPLTGRHTFKPFDSVSLA